MRWVKIKSRSGEDHAEYRLHGASRQKMRAVVIVSEYGYAFGWCRWGDREWKSQEYCHGDDDENCAKAMRFCESQLGINSIVAAFAIREP
jgi:hypothetical protein